MVLPWLLLEATTGLLHTGLSLNRLPLNYNKTKIQFSKKGNTIAVLSSISNKSISIWELQCS